MMKGLIAPVVSLLIVIVGLTFMTTNYEVLTNASETNQSYFIKHVPEVSMVLVEPNYGEFYHPNPEIQGDSSGKVLYSSLDNLALSYDIKRTEMIRFERKGKMIPNLYVFVDSPSEALQIADGEANGQDMIAANVEL